MGEKASGDLEVGANHAGLWRVNEEEGKRVIGFGQGRDEF